MAQLTPILPRLLLVWSLVCCGGCWRADSPATRFQVVSSSMAPTLLGPTLSANCPTCQYAFPIAAETYRPTLPTRCPNCGGLCDVEPTPRPGQTVLLQPLASSNAVQRWDLIAFQELASRTTQVKRVWGLPGESIELRQGEAWIDGALLRKSLVELRQVAVPVYDLSRGGGCQWWSTGEETRLVKADAVPPHLHVRAGQHYHLQHVRPAAVHPREVPAEQWLRASPVIDAYAINQGLSTTDHPVTDGLISLQLQRPLDGLLRIGLRSGEQSMYVWIQPAESSGSTERDAMASSISEFPTDLAPTTADFRITARQRIELGWCEGRLLIETDLQSRVVAAQELEALSAVVHALQPEQPRWEPHEICRITSSHAIDISHFRFARDLYLTAATNMAAQHTDFIADQSGAVAGHLAGFYVLGDNLAASRDSRQELGRVLPAQVLGRIVASPLP